MEIVLEEAERHLVLSTPYLNIPNEVPECPRIIHQV